MTEPQILISSTGRAGSGYISKVLRKYGIECGHESYFCFPWRRKKKVTADSSWIATDQLNTYGGKVFHQIRHPLKVLTSITATAKPWQPPRSKVWDVRVRMMPYRTGDLQRDFMAMIVWMNEEIERYADYRYKIEEFDCDTLRKICSISGTPFNRKKAVRAIQRVSNSYNKHHNNGYLTWADIPESKEKDCLSSQVERYGYK